MRIWCMLFLLLLCLPGGAQEKKPDWRLSGDARWRYENDTNRPSGPGRERGRIRYRIQLIGDLSKQLELGLRARTGDPHLPISANYSFLNSLKETETFGFNVDMAYLRYHPGDFNLVVGKSQAMFGANSPYGKLLWDTDYVPPGAWMGFQTREWSVRGGRYFLDAAPNYLPLGVNIADGSYRFKPSQNTELAFDVSFYGFDDTAGLRLPQNRGNAVSRGRLRSNFQLIDPSLTYSFAIGEVPVSTSLYYIKNLAASIPQDSAWAAGFAAGRLREPGDWSGFYRFQRVEQDALFSPVAQDDFTLAVNFEGHTAGVSHQLTQDLSAQAWVLAAEPLVPPGGTQFRYRLDLFLKY
ncbi:MAG: putative porin [Armatimonadetes bacterium]|nr:putative porin [Armatimonadota bacterium]